MKITSILRRIILSSAAHLAMSYFSTLHHKLYENPSSGKLSCSMRTHKETDTQTNVTKLIVTLRNFANAPTMPQRYINNLESYNMS